MLPIVLFSAAPQPFFYVQTDYELSPQSIVNDEKKLFENNVKLLRKAIRPGNIMWVKSSPPDQSSIDLFLQHNEISYEKYKEVFYRIPYPSLSFLINLESFFSQQTRSCLISWITVNSFFYGAMFLLLIYGWLIHTLFRHTSFRYYLYFHLIFTLLLLDADGWLQNIFWAGNASFSTFTIPFGIAFLMFLMILFTRRLLLTRQLSSLLDHSLVLLALLNLAAVIITVFVSDKIFLMAVAALAFATSLILLLITLYVLVSGKRSGQKSHLILWSMLLIAMGIEYFRAIGILPSNFFTLFILKASLFLEMLIISTSILLLRFSHLEKEEEKIEVVKQKSEHELLKHKRNSQRMQKKHDLLNKLAGVDSLTGLYNRREFFNMSESLLHRTKNSMMPYSLMMLDLDHFKNINDTYGHSAGDMVLVEVTKAISAHKRPNDIFGRIGGEEFAIFMPETDAKEAEALADELCMLVEKIKIETEMQSISVTVSIGVTSDNNSKSTLSELMRSSDIALYEAKDKGRNCVVSVKFLSQ